MKTIYDFKKGDEIVRVQPAKPYSGVRINLFGENEGGVRDRSYMGVKLIFVGILNGQIYCQVTDKLTLTILGDKLLNLATCSTDSECSGGQYCTYTKAAFGNVCACTSDRWWNPEILYCRKILI